MSQLQLFENIDKSGASSLSPSSSSSPNGSPSSSFPPYPPNNYTPSFPPSPSISPNLIPSLSRRKTKRDYAFIGSTFKVTADQLARWEKAFPNIPNLMAVLMRYDTWLGHEIEMSDKPHKKKAIFLRLVNFLAKKDTEFAEKTKAVARDKEISSGADENKILAEAIPLLVEAGKSETHARKIADSWRKITRSDEKLMRLILKAKADPKGMSVAKCVNLLVEAGTDPEDTRVWKNGFPPPALPLQNEDDEYRRRRKRAEINYDGGLGLW